MTNTTFLSLCLCLSGLYYVVTGIQYWVPDYMKEVLTPPVKDEVVNIYFTVTCFSGPVSGVICGGIVTTKLGGYNTMKSFKLIRIVGLCAVAVALPIPFLPTFPLVGSFFWLLLFFGGSILPSLTGIMISSVGDYQKA